MKKLILTFITCTILTLTSCSNTTDTTSSTSSTSSTASEPSTSSSATQQENDETQVDTSNTFDSFPRTIENYDGSMITIEEKPETIASMVFGTDEMLLDLSDLDKIIGLSGKDNGILYKSDPENKSSEISKINDNAEILTSLYPDAIIGASWVSAELQDVMADMDIPFYGYATPKTIEEQIKIVEDIGYFLGEDENANAIVDDMNTRLQNVVDITGTVEEKTRVMAYNIHGSTSAKGTMFDSMATTANTINISTEAGLEGTAEISKEQLVELNPEVIILVKWAKDTTEEFDSFLDEFMSDTSLSTIDAIANNRVYISLDNSITNVSHFAIDGLEFIAKSCYPELFE